MKRNWQIGSATAIALMMLASTASADELNMRRGITEISGEIYDLHMLILWICVAIGVVVFGAMFWSLIHHRKSAGFQPAKFHESTKLEIAWTLVPTLILVGIEAVFGGIAIWLFH